MRSLTSFARTIVPGGVLLVLAGSDVVVGSTRAELSPRTDDDQAGAASIVQDVRVDGSSQRHHDAGDAVEAHRGRVQSINVQNAQVLDARVSISPVGDEDGTVSAGLDTWSTIFAANESDRTAVDALTGGAGTSAGGFGIDAASFAGDPREPSLAIPLPPALLAAPVLAVAAELARRSMVRRRQ